jgi:ABC-2 type transport system permease protein/oleandomycin transport system permease protein
VIAQGTGDELKDRIGGKLLEVELVTAVERDRARSALVGIGCGEPEPGEAPAQLTLPAPHDGLAMIESAASALRRADVAVRDLRLRRPTLEDVFLQLTGAPPSEDEAASETASEAATEERPSLDVPAADTRPARPPAATRPPRWRRLSPGKIRAAGADARVISTRNLRHFIRQPDLLVFSTIQPISFVLLFAYVFGGAISPSLPRGVTYINYLLPGILVQSVTFRASMTALGLSDDLKLGVIDRFRTMPMARSAVLVGRTAADLVRNTLIIGLMILIGYIIGFRFQAGVVQALGSIVLVSAFGLALSWIFAFVALMVHSAEAAQSAGFVILFPLVFASSVFVPVSSMPSWLEAFANVSPVTLTADAARSLALAPELPPTLDGAIAWIAGILALFVPLSVWRYRRMT